VELTIFLALHVVAVMSLYVSEQSRANRDNFLMPLFAGLCFIALAFGLYQVDYYIPNGSVSSYTEIHDTSVPINMALSLLYGMFGIVYILNNYALYHEVLGE